MLSLSLSLSLSLERVSRSGESAFIVQAKTFAAFYNAISQGKFRFGGVALYLLANKNKKKPLLAPPLMPSTHTYPQKNKVLQVSNKNPNYILG
jgi:hypothetical protein